jgi:hypothetical protein
MAQETGASGGDLGRDRCAPEAKKEGEYTGDGKPHVFTKLRGKDFWKDDHDWYEVIIIYYVQASDGRIKIGRTKDDPMQRLSHLRVGSPLRLELVGMTYAPRYGEAVLHEMFADARSHGEWFYPVPALIKFIEKYARPYKPAHFPSKLHNVRLRSIDKGHAKALREQAKGLTS